ncbi:MAG: ATP-binding cassette domain-containing protein, partial [Armatimonadetes bacterium]|nr:ATP-binding cassette domain-containing protein [Armatimonadota bacterium]NIM24959.1 ATP-binding cassette domain-containing protein [Armatimonadota bacterium]NIM68845.1 ATP-binding cassette domain-containing protein [Armatimonadota bacterium]NIM77082.1 ATP-binding cassette domain-containing protein [Armatimonadota bacterium]NIN07052.1 ATP-binding cassette domain-containing protein [Armatimonadota bacterium]
MELKVIDLDAYYGNIRALHGVSLEVKEGEIVCLIGANGAGKTTCLAAVSGLLKPRRGHIRLGAEEITGRPAHAIARMGIAHVPEGRRIFRNLTVAENLDLGAYARKDRPGIEADLERVFTLFPVLKQRRTQAGGTLSGGEQQMLAIGRALMAQPRFLLLDEPSLGLAPFLVKQIFDTLKEINRAGTTILLVEQNAHLALELA